MNFYGSTRPRRFFALQAQNLNAGGLLTIGSERLVRLSSFDAFHLLRTTLSDPHRFASLLLRKTKQWGESNGSLTIPSKKRGRITGCPWESNKRRESFDGRWRSNADQ